MYKVCVIGAGNIGSRHLQGLKKVSFPLSLEVVDPSSESLQIARQRYNQIESSIDHGISFLKSIEDISEAIDLCIIATSSNVRRKIVEDLLSKSSVKYLILEKMLFQKKEDHSLVEELIKKRGVKTWVNFSMRSIPFYSDLIRDFGKPLIMTVSGSQYGLITNAIHYIDYIAYLTNCYDFTLDTKGLDPKPIESKRKGFLELNGTLNIHFKDGSFGSFTCFSNGDSPVVIELMSESKRVISKESETKAMISSSPKWHWVEIDSKIPYQSDITNIVVEEILTKGNCPLTPYEEASRLHLQLLDSLLSFLNQSSGKKFDLYPFT